MSEPQPELVRVFAGLIRRPVAVLMFVVALVGMSLIAASRIPVELIPSGFADSTITITAPWPGANPREVEQRVLRPLEEELRTIRGIQETFSVASESLAVVNLFFSGSENMDEAYAEVADRIERVRPRLPREVDRLRTRRWSASQMPVAWSAITYPPEKHDQLQGIIEDVLVPRIESVDGVANVGVYGLAPRSVRILLDEDRVSAHQVDIGALLQRLQQDNLSAPVGDVDDAGSRWIVRIDGRFDDLAEIEEYPVREGLCIKDIGRVIEARSVPEELFRIDGRYSLAMSIGKETSANTFEVSRRVKALLEEEGGLAQDPALSELGFLVWYNEGDSIEAALRGLVENAALGGVIACAVLFAFLRRFRYTLLVALSIPFSVLATLSWLYFSGDSFNALSMMGITISIGMLVDNSVVIVESIFHRRERGEPLDLACERGPADMVLAVTTATLTTVVAFLPMIFLSEDRNTRLMTQSIGLPLCVALLAALALAIVIVPVTSYHLGRKSEHRRSRLARLLAAVRLPGWALEAMPRLTRWSLRHRLGALSLAGLFLVSAQWAAAGNPFEEAGGMGGEMDFDFKLSPNLTLAEAEAAITPLEEALHDPALRAAIGDPFIGIQFDKQRGEVNLWHDVPPSRDERERIRKLLKERLPESPALELKIEDRWDRMNRDDKQWTRVGIQGPDSLIVAGLAEEVRRLARLDPYFVVVAEPDEASREMLVTLDRERLQRAGTSTQAVLGTIEWALRGIMVSRFETGHGDVPIIMEFDEVADPDKERLAELGVAGWDAGAPLPLSTFANFEHRRGPGAIVRRDGRTTDVVGLKAAERDMEKTAGHLAELMAKLEMPEGYRWQQDGGWREFEEDMAEMQSALMLSIALVFFLMGLLFESLILPFSVIVTIPFAFVGAVWAFKLTGESRDMTSMIGMIVLAGIVVNNGIVLVDRILRLRAGGIARSEAIVQGVRDRLRPVVMTAVTTIAGLLPMALSKPDGTTFSFKGLAIGVSGGLTFTTFFTLWVVPLCYSLLDDLGAGARAIFLRRRAPATFDR